MRIAAAGFVILAESLTLNGHNLTTIETKEKKSAHI
jgi:hypothetical protein